MNIKFRKVWVYVYKTEPEPAWLRSQPRRFRHIYDRINRWSIHIWIIGPVSIFLQRGSNA